MSFCQTCGSEHASDARFCPSCGTGVGAVEKSPAPAESPASSPPPPPTLGASPAPPPPPTAAHRAASSAEEAKSLNGLSTSLVVLFIIGAVVSLVGAALALSAMSDLDAIRDDSAFVPVLRADDANTKIGAAAVVWSLAAVPIFVLLVIWTHRAHRNLKSFGAENPMLPTGMAIGSWFIPLFFYLGPYWCISDAYKGAAPDAGDSRRWREGRGSAVVLAWWLTFCAANVLFWISSAMASTDGTIGFGDSTESLSVARDIVDDPDRYQNAWTVAALAYVASIAAAVLGALAIRAVNRRQQDRMSGLGQFTSP